MSTDDQLADLYLRWKASAQAGAPLSADEVCLECPELLQDFRNGLPAWQAVDALFDADESKSGDATASFDVSGYRSLTFHRQGGLGVVLLGEEVELRRPVAIKRLKPRSPADGSADVRLIAEAEITARLDHPGVVPIYRAGRDRQGQPYYAMRFVQGETFAEAISRYHEQTAAPDSAAGNLEFRRLVRCLIAVCQTVAYAHSRGVIHRDLKPDNIILGAFGEVVVLDWGLAKRVYDQHDQRGDDTSSASAPTSHMAANHSVAGIAKGAPAFMSPEQARGDWESVGPESDIYGLGATLYVLLSGELPYSGGTAVEVIGKVLSAPPDSPSLRNPAAPRSLAAVCHKAMARQPADRYRTAQDLASDLERWLADEGVSVMRDSLLTQAQRWMRRNRSIVAGGFAAVSVLVVASVAMAIQERRSADRERAAKERLSVAYTRLRQASVVFLGHAVSEPSSPQMHQALADIRQHFVELNDGEISDLFELGAIDNVEGALYLRSGKPDLATRYFESAEALLSRASDQAPDDPDVAEALATTWLNLGSALDAQNEPVAALQLFEQALVLTDKLQKATEDADRYQSLRRKLEQAAGRACWRWANFRWVAGDAAEAALHFDRAQSFLGPLAALEPELPGIREDYRLNLLSWGQFLQNQGIQAFQDERFADAVDEFENGVRVWEELAGFDPDDAVVARHYRNACAGLASACQRRADQLKAERDDEAIELERVLRLGISAIDRLPPFLRETQELLPLRSELQRQLELFMNSQ